VDNVMATVRYDDGSVASLLYTALGASDLSKEYVEIYADSKVMMIDDYRALRVYGVRVKAWKSQAQDKGQRGESGVRDEHWWAIVTGFALILLVAACAAPPPAGQLANPPNHLTT